MPISFWPVLALALIHLFGGRLSFLSGTPRSIWLSVAGGVSIAYIFLHLFPELAESQEHYHQDYRLRGRWVLVAALVLGWCMGFVLELKEPTIAVVTAFIGGGVISNVLKEELPEERESRYRAFLLGAAAYGMVLLAM